MLLTLSLFLALGRILLDWKTKMNKTTKFYERPMTCVNSRYAISSWVGESLDKDGNKCYIPAVADNMPMAGVH